MHRSAEGTKERTWFKSRACWKFVSVPVCWFTEHVCMCTRIISSFRLKMILRTSSSSAEEEHLWEFNRISNEYINLWIFEAQCFRDASTHTHIKRYNCRFMLKLMQQLSSFKTHCSLLSTHRAATQRKWETREKEKYDSVSVSGWVHWWWNIIMRCFFFFGKR